MSEQRALSVLTGRDRGLASIVQRHGPPPLWARRPGFATLARIILEQQVSLAAAATLFKRVEREIAKRLSLSEGTVRNYLSESIAKLGVSNRIEAARLARQRGWL